MLNRKTAWLALGGAFVALSTTAAGCSLVIDPDNKQCSVDADCNSLGFVGTYCGPGNVCVSLAEYCSTNAQCIDRNGRESFICQKDAQNSSNNRCVELTTKECPKLFADPGDLRNDAAIVVAHMGMPSLAPTLSANQNSIELARQDFRNLIPAGVPGEGARPIVVIACDASIYDDDDYQIALDHVIDNVKVPAVLGPLPGAHITYAINKAIPNRNPLVFTPAGIGGEQFTDLPGRVGIFFRNALFGDNELIAAARLVRDVIEPRLQAEGVARPIKVGLVKGTIATGGGLTAAFTDNVVFNGKSALDNGDNYREFSWGDPEAPGLDARVSAAAIDASAWQPDVLLMRGNAEGIDFVRQLETALPNHTHFLMNTTHAQQRTADMVGTNENWRTRLWFIQGGRSVKDRNLATYLARHQSAFPDDAPSGEPPISAGGFDTFYLLAFAIAANGANPVTGENLGIAMQTRLQGGTPIDMGPEQNLLAINTLANGGNIDYNGAFNTSHFDAKGDIGVDYLYQCITLDPSAPYPFTDTGLTFDSTTSAVKGTNTCFPAVAPAPAPAGAAAAPRRPAAR